MFAGIWLIIFSDFKKIPTDYDQTVDFQGTYSVLAEREFIQELLSSRSINGLLASPESMFLLANRGPRNSSSATMLNHYCPGLNWLPNWPLICRH